MSVEILPHKALNDINSMHSYLKEKVLSSSHVTDLIPFINALINIDNLKKQILTSLNKQYETETSKQSIESKSKLRSLFISLFSLNGIPSDSMHANIISFLPSKEYKKLPILSKHFRNVMINNPFIFNDRGYNLRLQFCEHKFSDNKQSLISINHERNMVTVADPSRSRRFWHIVEEKKAEYEHKALPVEILQFHKIKCWRLLMYKHFVMPNSHTHPEVISILEDKHNAYLLDTIFKNNQTIGRLNISLSNIDIIGRVFEQKESFNQLHALLIDHLEFDEAQSVAPKLNLDTNSFINLQYLEFGINMKTCIDHINDILEFTCKTLRAVKCTYISTGDGYNYDRGWGSYSIGSDKCIKLPADNNIEWLYMARCCLTLDMTLCDNLIGIVLICIDGQMILWPKYTIPFVYVCDKLYVSALRTNMLYRHDYWKWKVKDKKINGKFILLKKVQKNDDKRGAREELSLVDDEYMGIIKKVCIDDYMMNVENDDDKCLLLRAGNVDKELLGKIMKYAVKDDNRRDIKYKMYDKWRSLHCANWIWDLHNHS